MKNTITLKNKFRSRFLLFVLLMVFSMSGFAQQMHIVGLDNDWNNFQSMEYNADSEVYTFTVKPSEDGWFSWKFTEDANWGGRQWVNESNVTIDFGAPIDWEFRTTFPEDPPSYGAWLTQDRYYTIVMNRPTVDENIEGYVFESLTAPISYISNIDLNPKPYNVTASDEVVVTLTANKAPNSNETVYAYVYTYAFGDELLPFTFVDNIGTAIIPAMPEGTRVNYGIVSSFVSSPVHFYDYFLLSEWSNAWVYSVQDPDGAAIAYFSHGFAVDVAVDVNPTITFDKDVYKIGGASFAVDEDVTALVIMRESAAHAPVAFSATINERVITIVPDADLVNSTNYNYGLYGNVVQSAAGFSQNYEESRSFTTITPLVDVVFTVDMNYEVYVNGWDPVNGNVVIRGSWDQNWAAPIAMTDVDGDNVFTGILPNRIVGEEIHYKFVKDGGDWESIANRSFTVDLSAPDAPLAHFNNNILLVESDILSFTIAEQADDAIINSVDKTIALEVLYGTNLTNLTPTFTLSPGATADVASGVARDFSSEVTYSITPYDNSAATDWTVNVTVLSVPLTDNVITSFSFAEQTAPAIIDADNATIAIEVAYDADITNLTPAITISAGATIDPVASPADFSNDVVYTVTAQDDSQKEWTVTVTLQPSYIVSLSVNMNKQFNMGAFDPATDGVSIAGNFNDWIIDAIFDADSDLIYTFTKAVPVGYNFEFKFQMLKDGITNWENMDDNRSYTSIDGVNADIVWFNNEALNIDATLQKITVNGITVTGVDLSSTFIFAYPLPAGSDVPEVLGTANDQYAQSVTPTQAAAFPGEAIIKVIAEDGTTEQTYTIDLIEGDSKIATLKTLTVNGTSVANFDPDTYDYNFEMPYGTTELPTVAGEATDDNASSVSPTQITSYPAPASVRVVAQDGVSELTYTIWISVALNNDATLSDLTINGSTVAGFAADKLIYIHPIDVSSFVTTEIGFTTTDINAYSLNFNPSYINGTGNGAITVYAENGTTQLSYWVIVTDNSLSNDATLSKITVAGIEIVNFDAASLNYSVELPYGTTEVPEVLGTPNEVTATIWPIPAMSLSGTAIIQVTAQDGATRLRYKVSFTVAKNPDATLSALTIDGVTVADFASDKYVYTKELAFGTTEIPVVNGTANNPDAESVTPTQATALPGEATVKVIAEDGTTQLTYTVNFTIAPNDDATLSNLTVDDVTIDDFDANTLVYAMELPFGTTSVEVLGTVTDDNAEVENNQANTLPGAATVVVTAEDGTTERTYTVNFTIAPNDDATLSDLTVDGVTIDDFNANTLVYAMELPFGTTSVEVLGTVTDDNAEVENNQASILPGAATVVVTAEDATTQLTYTVNLTIAAPDTNAKLSGIRVDGEMIADFDADVFSYDVQLASGTTLVPTVLATTESETASIEQTDAGVIPGTTVIKVLAQDRVTELEYKVNFTISSNIHDVENIVSKVYPNPTNGNVTIKLGRLSENTQLRITDMSGRTILIQELSQLETTVDLANNPKGIYIVTVTSNDSFYMGKILFK